MTWLTPAVARGNKAAMNIRDERQQLSQPGNATGLASSNLAGMAAVSQA
jgi:hypothetical protein